MPLQEIDPLGPAYFELRHELQQNELPLYRPLPDWNDPTWRAPQLEPIAGS